MKENWNRREIVPLRVGYTFDANYKPGDHVHIDGEQSIEARVAGVLWRGVGSVAYDVVWFAAGVMQSAWLPADRLSLALPA